jgi:hypothetical protein
MIDEIDYTERITGPYGTVDFVKPPGLRDPRISRKNKAANQLSRGMWLINSPGWHPLWSQYVMSAISLKSHRDLPEAKLKFEGATHEILLVALNPDFPQTVGSIKGHAKTGKMPFLKPVNIAEQFECTDDEVRQMCWYACRAVVYGGLNPETSDAPNLIRENWLTALTKTLAHIRGEAHAE